MRAVVPYANDVSDPCVHEAVKLNLRLLGIEADWVRMHEPNDYALLMRRLWDKGDRFLLIEHDVIPWRGAADAVWECDQPICGYDGSLQCAAITPVGECPVPADTVWVMVDTVLLKTLWARGVVFHEHCVLPTASPPVTNLNRANIPPRHEEPSG